MKGNRICTRMALAGALALASAAWAGPAQAGSVCYLVTVDSTGLSGTTGFLDFQLNASTSPTNATVTSTISEFTSDGTVGTVNFQSGSVTPSTGGLTNPSVSIDNTQYGEIQQNFTYGTKISFEVTLSGSEVNNGSGGAFSGTIFTFIMQDSNQNGLNSGPLANEALDMYVNPTGAGSGIQVDTYGPASGNYPTITVGPCAAVPEPSSLIMMGIGVTGLLAFRKLRQAS